jgi:uncharacterized protein
MTPDGPPDPLHRSTTVRRIYVFLGTVFLGIGLLGIVLPVLPTTPFLLLAAACYARGSARLYAWMLADPRFGPVIRNWRESRTIPRRAKRNALLLLALVLGVSIVFVVEAPLVRLALVVIGIAVGTFIARIPPAD